MHYEIGGAGCEHGMSEVSVKKKGRTTLKKRLMFGPLIALLLAACASEQRISTYVGLVAAPQVAYRIDDHRYFEVVPLEGMSCAHARLYYTDKARNIHSDIASWDRVANGAFIIDAANDQFLIGPILLSNANCQTGDSANLKCASRLPYSVDGGRTWKYNIPQWSDRDVYMTGAEIYTGGARASIVSLADGLVPDVWHSSRLQEFPQTSIRPLDTRLECSAFKKGVSP